MKARLVRVMWQLIRCYGNGRVLTAWKLFGYYAFRRGCYVEPTRRRWGPWRRPG